MSYSIGDKVVVENKGNIYTGKILFIRDINNIKKYAVDIRGKDEFDFYDENKVISVKDFKEECTQVHLISKAIKNGIYGMFIEGRENLYFSNVSIQYIDNEYMLIALNISNTILKLSDYKKTWFLKPDKSE